MEIAPRKRKWMLLRNIQDTTDPWSAPIYTQFKVDEPLLVRHLGAANGVIPRAARTLSRAFITRQLLSFGRAQQTWMTGPRTGRLSRFARQPGQRCAPELSDEQVHC